MFRPYESPPSRPPSKPDHSTLSSVAMEAAAPAVDVPPLPSNWDQLDPDQRVRSIGEW